MATRSWVSPRTGESKELDLELHTGQQVREVAVRSKAASEEYRLYAPSQRADVLEALASGLEQHVEELVGIADLESALGPTRLTGEVARTAFQLRMFATALKDGTILTDEKDEAVEGAPPAGRPELVRKYQGLGPVAVFGASNFPFAFSVLGGDTASALAAGCSVVVKEHSAHPMLGARTVEMARHTLERAGHNPDIVLSVRGTEAGAELVAAPEIAAVGFTGSLAGGRALYDIAVNRPSPVPFYGELGSVNRVVITPGAAADRPEELGRGFVESLLLGAGQFCTKPSVLLYPHDSKILDTVRALVESAEPMALLTPKIAGEYGKRVKEMSAVASATVSAEKTPDSLGAWVTPVLFEASVEELLSRGSQLNAECFGPAGVAVGYRSNDEVLQLLDSDEGMLVGCLHAEEDEPEALAIAELLGRRAGRVVWNGWPTGVAVSGAQMHGGPYPAATVPGATSVGLHAVMRFVRPVVWQSFPSKLLR